MNSCAISLLPGKSQTRSIALTTGALKNPFGRVISPDSWNPVTMVTASLAHAGLWHLFGNLLFYAQMALDTGKPLVAKNLVANSAQRYGELVNTRQFNHLLQLAQK